MKRKKALDTLEKTMRYTQTHRTVPSPDDIWQAGIMDAVWQEGPHHDAAGQTNRIDRLLRRIIVLATAAAMIAMLLCGYEYFRSNSLIEYQTLNDPAQLTLLAMNQ
jgi:hypothetical protein